MEILKRLGVVILIIGFGFIVFLVSSEIYKNIYYRNSVRETKEELYRQCKRDNKEVILKEINNCIEGSGGHSVRCEDIVKRTYCI